MSQKQNEWNKHWMAKQEEHGLCIFCRSEKLPNSRLCEKHYFSSIAGSVLKNTKLGSAISELFYAQEGKCYLTGEKLILGVNAGLDHIIPQSKNMLAVDDLTNIAWVDSQMNRVKNDLTYDEFLSVCKKVIEYSKPIKSL